MLHALVLAAALATPPEATPLFDGATLEGWHAIGGGTWTVEDGAIVGRAAQAESRHGLLVSDGVYDDFIVTFDYRVNAGDSGFYFRVDESGDAVGVHGFQVEVDDVEPGGLYETGGRAWVVKRTPEEAEAWHRAGAWNRVTLRAVAGDVTVTVNGHETAALRDDPGRRRGHFALQLHGGQDMHVAFRDIRVTPVTPTPERPNILWLVVEDMSPWLACYGDDTVPTPHLDGLAARAGRYVNAFATSPVCAPARSSIITGMYATRIGSMHMRCVNRSQAALDADPHAYDDIPIYQAVPPPFVRAFPEHLRAAGYYCTNRSKTDYQMTVPAATWDASSNRAHWRRRAEGQPFFAVFNHGGTHESRAFPDARRAPEVVTPEAVPLPPIYPDTPAVRDAMARTYNNIARMDGWVGDRLAELEADGLLESTIIFFYSDHGVGLPRGKRSCYDTGTRVPLLIAAPPRFAHLLPDDWTAGGPRERVVSFVDFGPTVLSLAGIEPDARLDGTPFLGPYAQPGTGLAFAHADRFDSVYDHARSVTDGRMRYIRNEITDIPHLIANRYRERLPMTADLYALRGRARLGARWQVASTRRPREELYDSALDPWEVHNLAEDPAYAERLGHMRARLDAWIASTDDLGYVRPETALVREHLWPPDGAQPVTADPGLAFVGGADGTITIRLSCATPGASIGYRFGDDGAWRPYRTQLRVVPARVAAFRAQAHRLGFAPSAIVSPDLAGRR